MLLWFFFSRSRFQLCADLNKIVILFQVTVSPVAVTSFGGGDIKWYDSEWGRNKSRTLVHFCPESCQTNIHRRWLWSVTVPACMTPLGEPHLPPLVGIQLYFTTLPKKIPMLFYLNTMWRHEIIPTFNGFTSLYFNNMYLGPRCTTGLVAMKAAWLHMALAKRRRRQIRRAGLNGWNCPQRQTQWAFLFFSISHLMNWFA